MGLKSKSSVAVYLDVTKPLSIVVCLHLLLYVRHQV